MTGWGEAGRLRGTAARAIRTPGALRRAGGANVARAAAPAQEILQHRNMHHIADEQNVRGMTGKGRRHGPPAVHPPGIVGTRQDGDSETQRHNILS